jgi:hypothetical protein
MYRSARVQRSMVGVGGMGDMDFDALEAMQCLPATQVARQA